MTILNQEIMQQPERQRPMFGPLCIRATILPFLCSCPFLVSMFAVGLCVLWVLCGPSKATARCYTSICDGIIYTGRLSSWMSLSLSSCLSLCVSLSVSSRGHHWIVRIMSFRNMYFMWVALLKSLECGCLSTIGLQRDNGDDEEEEEEKTTFRSVPDGSDKNA